MDSGRETHGSYVPGIDGLRAIAILSVVVYHFDHLLLPGGFTGVDIFFVVSGYVISRSLAASDATSLLAFITGFYQRRILRIVPALLACLIVTAIASSLFVPDAWLSEHNKWTAMWAFLGVSNIYLVHVADGYFAARTAFNPFLHTWSLAVEEQFYLLFPLIVFAGQKAPATRLILPAIALASLATAAYDTPEAHERAFYMLQGRFWELAAGAMLFQFHARGALRCRTPEAANRLLLAASAAFALGFLFAREDAFPFPWAIVPVAGALLAIAGTTGDAGPARGIRKLLESGAMSYVGRISYSLYLWHWPVFSLYRWTVGLSGPLTAALSLTTAFVLAVLSYHLLENPVRRSRRLKTLASWKVIAAGAGAVASSFVFTGLLFKYDDAMGIRLTVTANVCDWSPYAREGCPAPALPRGFDAAGRKVLVIGDSHAGAYTAMAMAAASQLNARAMFHARPGCSIAMLIALSHLPACRNYENEVVAWVTQHGSPDDVVFLASLRIRNLAGQLSPAEGGVSTLQGLLVENSALALEEAGRVVERLHALRVHVLMDAPKPIFLAPPFRCSDWFNRFNPICEPGFTMDREYLLGYREPAMALLRKLRESHGIRLWDPFPVLCPGPVCSAFDGDRPIFMDTSHLSGHGNRLLVESFANELTAIWRQP